MDIGEFITKANRILNELFGRKVYLKELEHVVRIHVRHGSTYLPEFVLNPTVKALAEVGLEFEAVRYDADYDCMELVFCVPKERIKKILETI
ncbi:hypothetical protein DRP04_00150 [Archaeoglobales archaeon]|jgi:hypothetical protein|nr:MAG: hypothetical protein DRP04_00150 [Archaeoglobales archaeon]